MSRTDIRLDLYREKLTGRYRWRVWRQGNILADSGQAYSRRIDCLAGAGRALGFDPAAILWLGGMHSPRIYDYGQVTRATGLVEVNVWKRRGKP